ncbi:hypothetical protein SAMN06272775_6052 [Streptomyces sp. 2323.1]|nr:hypothetical protein SAMN06272775_6052 [Streptomyces sp. 2323.1]
MSTRGELGPPPWLRPPGQPQPAPTIRLDLLIDCAPDQDPGVTQRDEPVSFDPRHRRYGARGITSLAVHLPATEAAGPPPHDPITALRND